MKNFLKAVVLVPVAILLLAFAVANREIVSISFDPFSDATPAFALVAPMFLVVFLLVMAGVLIGGVASWLGQGRYRSAARRAQAEADDLRDELERLRTEMAIQSRQFGERTKALPREREREQIAAVAASDA